jgi:hypothetical protein
LERPSTLPDGFSIHRRVAQPGIAAARRRLFDGRAVQADPAPGLRRGRPRQLTRYSKGLKVIQLDIAPDEIGHNKATDVALVGDSKANSA